MTQGRAHTSGDGRIAVRVRVRRLAHGHGLELPATASEGRAGFDLRAAVEGRLEVAPGERALVPTGLALEIPSGWEGQVRPRSGLAYRLGLTLPNSPGTIDSDYRGEVKVIVQNLGEAPIGIDRGDRIAQLVIGRVPRVSFEVVDELGDTDRGAGGFGSTGVD